MFPNVAVFVQSWPDQQEGVHQHTSGLSETIANQVDWCGNRMKSVHLDYVWITSGLHWYMTSATSNRIAITVPHRARDAKKSALRVSCRTWTFKLTSL